MNEKKIDFQAAAEELKTGIKGGNHGGNHGGNLIALPLDAIKATSCWGARIMC